MKFLGQGFQKLEPKQDRHTDRQTEATKYQCVLSYCFFQLQL